MKPSLSFLFAIVCFTGFAQKVDLDRFHFTVQYRNMPNKQLSKEYNTYNLLFGGSPTSKNYMMEDDMNPSIFIHGWKKVSSNGHISVKTSFGDFMIKSSTVNERKEEVKDKDGKVTGYRYYYSTVIVYNFPISYQVIDNKGPVLLNETVSSNDKTWTTEEYSSYKMASDYYNNNRSIVRSNLARTNMTQALSAISSSLNYYYGYPPTNNPTKLWILDNKKHPEYEPMQVQWKTFKEVAARVTYEGVSEEDKKTLLSVIAYFDGLKTKYATSDKADKKLRYAGYFNNAMIYMWFLDNFDAAIKEAEGLIANDFDTGDGKDLRKEAEKFKENLKKNKVSSLHYVINVDNNNNLN
jgi:hypothetical protein